MFIGFISLRSRKWLFVSLWSLETCMIRFFCQKLEICSGDLVDLKAKSVDVEVCSPRRKEFLGVGSCSHSTGAQTSYLGLEYC